MNCIFSASAVICAAFSVQNYIKEVFFTELSTFFKSVIDQDTASVVICDLEHTIIYMNPVAAARYAKYGGFGLVGKSLLDCHNQKSCEMIGRVIDWFSKSADNNIIYTSFNPKENKDIYMVALRDENKKLIGYYEKHEYRNRETCRMYDFT